MKKKLFTFSALLALKLAAFAQNSPITIYGNGLSGSGLQLGAIYADNGASAVGMLIEAPLNASNTKLPLSFGWRGEATPWMVLAANGNLGIGKTNPINKLSLWEANPAKWQLLEINHSGITNSQFVIGNINDTYPVINQRNSNIIESYNDLHISAANANSKLFFETGRVGAQSPIRMTIDNAGRVGIGTTTPTLPFEVAGAAAIQQTLTIKSNNVNSSEVIMYKETGGSYYSLVANSGGFGIYNAEVPGYAWFASPQNNIGIGTTTPGEYKLAVNGKVKAQSMKVTMTGWPDYVFESDYNLPSIPELDAFIKKHKHLPDVPDAGEVEKEGIDLGQMNKALLQKVEELTLYMIDQHKKMEVMQQEMETLKKLVEQAIPGSNKK